MVFVNLSSCLVLLCWCFVILLSAPSVVHSLAAQPQVNRKAVMTAAAIEFVKNRNPAEALSLYNNLPASPYLWQRGLVAYCASEFEVAGKQFRFDRSVNGGDGEEALWECASLARLNRPRSELLDSLPPKGLSSNDPRAVIRDSVKLYYDFLSLPPDSSPAPLVEKLLTSSNIDTDGDKTRFYADLYVALFYESLCPSPTLARSYLAQALNTAYGKSSNDFMVATADNMNRNKS